MILQNNRILKFFLNVFILTSFFVSIYNIMDYNSIYTIINIFSICLIYISILISKKNLRSKYKTRLVIILVLSVFILLFRSYLSNKDFINNYFHKDNPVVNNLTSEEVKDVTTGEIDISKLNAEQLLYLFEEQKEKNLERVSLVAILQKLIVVSKSEATTTNPKTFSTLGKAYSAAFVFGVDGAEEYAINSFAIYCKLLPDDAECYANFARFIGLDNTKHDTALEYAKKALAHAKNKDEIEVYSKLVEQYSK